MPKIQSFLNKKGEVNFRKKLTEQFNGKTVSYPGEPSALQYSEIIKGRINDYTKYFDELKNKEILQTPYLELGAGVGQGAMLLENNYHLVGFTSDISFETLWLTPKYKKELKFKKMPIRIVCDIYNLPFRNESIPFVFTFQTLHHLPDPYPVLKEVKRVLTPGGFFYFNEEPITQALNFNLWRRDRNLRWFEKILKATLVLHFISKIGKSEVEHNILEETFTLKTWEKALNIFSKVQAKIVVFPFKKTIIRKKTKYKNWLRPPFLKNILLQMLGGGIEGLCQNHIKTTIKKPLNFLESLACPNCLSKPKIILTKNRKGYICKQCNSIFPIKNDILILLSTKQKKLLYPNL